MAALVVSSGTGFGRVDFWAKPELHVVETAGAGLVNPELDVVEAAGASLAKPKLYVVEAAGACFRDCFVVRAIEKDDAVK